MFSQNISYLCTNIFYMKKEIIINGISIPYTINHSRRKTVGIQVMPDGSVEIRAPYLYSASSAEDLILRHARWIMKRRNVYENKESLAYKFVSGEYHYFLGEKYLLQVVEGQRNTIKFENNCFNVTCTFPENVELIMNQWYRKQATAIFERCAKPIIEQFKKYNVAPKVFTIRKMRSRWGSCSRRGNISLNLELIKLPEACICEVITHELCHLVYFDHSKDFYALMDKEMPDWKVWKEKLKFV